MFNKMPKHDFCERQDDKNIVHCDLKNNYKSCQPSEKFCRFAYASWCPVCDIDSHRRRSKSETIDYHYRKRCRDMTNQSPNMKDSKNVEYLDLRDKLDSSRVLTNLCELPTTYINNCQTNVPSYVDDSVIAKRFSNFVEPLCNDRAHVTTTRCNESPPRMANNSIRNGDILKNNGFSKHHTPSHKVVHVDKTHRNACIKNNTPTKMNETLPCDHSTHAIIKEQIIHAVKGHYENNHIYPKNSPCNREFSPQHSPKQHILTNHVCREASQDQNTRENACCTRRHLPTPKSPIRSAPIQFFKEAGDAKKIPENNFTEIKEKIYAQYNFPVYTLNSPSPFPVNEENSLISIAESKRRVRQRSESDTSNEILSEKPIETCTVIPKKAREISPLENKKEPRPKSAVKVASIKNRHKLSAIKLRKVRSKIAHSVSSDSNHSESESSETEDEEKTDSETFDNLFSSSSSVNINGSTPIISYTPVAGTQVQDLDKWPIRLSLFPHIPPYISFSAHDSEEFSLPAGVARFLKWKLSTITPIVVRKTLTNTGFRLVRSEYSRESNDWSGTWGKHIKSVGFQSLKETQKLNHFPGTFQIGRKDRLWKNLHKLMFRYGQKEFGFIPRSFVLPNDMKLLRQAWEKTGHEKWIIKPPASARGTGIKVIHRWAHLPKKRSLVVQQYISNPYLINGSKFDLRLYVLVTSFNPLRIYLYPEGLARFASTKYSDDLSTLNDRYMHLTNYSINKLSSHYTANEDANACKGHKWTLSKLWEYLEKNGVNTKLLWRNLQQLVIKTMLCGESSISSLCKSNLNSRYNCYELFGVDVLLDDRLKPWLLEVNISPSLHSASPLDLHVKGPLVQSLLNLAQFHLPPKLARIKQIAPPCYNCDLYSTQLTNKERLKQMHFSEFEKREEYLKDILKNLTGDDVRHLTQAEDELTVIGDFERIFPTQHSHYYFQFMETRYYNRLFDAWEYRYEKDRRPGIKLLQTLCEKKIHLTVAPKPTVKPPLSKETSQESSPEVTTSDEPVRPTLPKRPQTSPVPANVDPTINALRSDVGYRMMNLKLGIDKPLTPI